MHIPAEWGGLPTKETIWRVFDPSDSHPNSKRIGRWLTQKGVKIPGAEDSTVLLIARKRKDGSAGEESSGKNFHDSGPIWRWIYAEVERSKVLGIGTQGDKKLRAIKGGKLIADNFGMALFPDASKGEPKYLPLRHFRVWEQLKALPKDTQGRRPPILRRGQIITFEKGKWSGNRWRVLGIEENGRVRFFEPDKVRRIDNPENYQKAQISSLLRDGITIVDEQLTGRVYSG
jgi:hypothetical protein